MSKLNPGDRVTVDAGLGITKTGNVQRITESTVYVKHYNGAVVGYKAPHVTKVLTEQVAIQPRGVGLASEFAAFALVMEKKLTPAELKKREEVATAIERENPDMDMSKKMAIATATAKKVAEDTEQIDELSQDTLKSYASKVAMDAMKHEKDPTKRPAEKRSNSVSGFSKALNRLPAQKFFNKEEAEQIDELKSSTLKRYIDKAEDSYAKTNDPKVKAKRDAGLDRADDKLERKANDRNPFKEDMHYCAKHVFSERFGEGLVVEGSHAEPNEQGLIEWYDVDFGGTVRRVMTEKVKVMHAEYHMNHKKKMKEEEELEEAKPHTVPKTAKEKSLAALAEPKDKITHADVMVGRGIKKEEAELEEATENLPGKATHLTKVDVRHPDHGIISGSTTLRHLGGNKYEVRAGRAKGKTVALDDKHVQKMSEEIELDEAMISYSDFQSKIASHRKAGNQIKDDKYDKKKASYTVIDQEGTAKKITHTDAGVSQQHLGSMKRDDDESSETKPTEKRGRGRPAGSKSGARN